MSANGVDGTSEQKTCFQAEFSIKKISLRVEDPRAFVRFVANKGYIPVWYLLFKLIVCLLVTSFNISDITIETITQFRGKFYIWFFFATNWSFVFLWLYFLFSCINTCRYFRSQQNYSVIQGNSDVDCESHDVWTSVQFFLHSVSCNSNFLVTFIFWVFFHTLHDTPKLELVMSGIKHTLNTVIILTDLTIGNIPIRLLHVVYPLLIGILYCFCSVVFFELNFIKYTDGSLYKNLNWLKDPELSALLYLMALLFTIPVQIFLFLLYRIKISLFKSQK